MSELSVSREKHKPKGWSKLSREWGIVVRLANGDTLYYIIDGTVNSAGLPVECWGRVSQAHRFPTEQQARHVAEGMQANSVAKEYFVVPLPFA